MFSGLKDRLGGPGGLAAWVDENVPMLGRKVAGLARGYGFNGHRDVIADTKAHAVDPQERFWLTRSEMDKVYTRPLFTQHPGMQVSACSPGRAGGVRGLTKNSRAGRRRTTS